MSALRPLDRVALHGLIALPSQAFGPLQLVPLVRRSAVDDLPLAALPLARDADDDGVTLLPHGVVTGFDEGAPRVAFGTQLARRGAKMRAPVTSLLTFPIGRRDVGGRARMMPMHLALEGALLQVLGVNPDGWTRFSRDRRATGAARPQSGAVRTVAESALRTFEVDAHQSGMLLYAADTLLTAFVAPSPAVYLALHRAFVGDLLGGTMQYLLTRDPARVAERPFRAEIPGRAVRTLDDLREALALASRPWATAQEALDHGVLPSPAVPRASDAMKRFTLRRFTTSFARGAGNGLGEVVHRDDGAIAWLAFHRLSDAQAKRAYLLAQLAVCGWSLANFARAGARGDVADIERQVINAGLGHVLEAMAPRPPVPTPRRGR